MPQNDELASINLGNGFKRVERPGKSPRPGGDRTPLVGRRPRLAWRVKEGFDSVLKAIVEVRVDIAVIRGDERVPTRQHALNLPARCTRSSRRLRGPVVRH